MATPIYTYGFKDRKVAEALSRSIRIGSLVRQHGTGNLKPIYRTSRVYVMEADEVITGANHYLPTEAGHGLAHILERPINDDMDYTIQDWEPAGMAGGEERITEEGDERVTEDGETRILEESALVQEDVLNLSQIPFAVGEKFLAVQDMDGNFWAIRTQWDYTRRGKVITSALNYGSSGPVQEYRGGVAVAGSSDTVHFVWLGKTGDTLAVGTKVNYKWNQYLASGAGAWELDNANCEAG